MWVSSTEPLRLRALGKSSTFPERFGVDLLMKTGSGLVGIQRKEVKDLLASVVDGRLNMELGQMAQLRISVLLIEGTVQWSRDGEMVKTYGQTWTRRQWLGMLWSVQDMGVWVAHVKDMGETIEWVQTFEMWVGKTKHRSLMTRPKAKGAWGKPDNREFAVHVLQGIPGMGPDLAGRIYDAYGLPLRWTVDVADLMGIDGIGKVKANALIGALYPRDVDGGEGGSDER